MEEAQNQPDEATVTPETAEPAAPLNRAARRQAKGGKPAAPKGPGFSGGPQVSPKFNAGPARNTGTGHRRKV